MEVLVMEERRDREEEDKEEEEEEGEEHGELEEEEEIRIDDVMVSLRRIDIRKRRDISSFFIPLSFSLSFHFHRCLCS